MRIKRILALLLLAAATYAAPYKNSISLFMGLRDGIDVKYERRIGSLGLGLSPGLGSYLITAYSKPRYAIPNYDPLLGYQPALYVSYHFPIGQAFEVNPELKFGYGYFKARSSQVVYYGELIPILPDTAGSGPRYTRYETVQSMTVSPRFNFQLNSGRLSFGGYLGVTAAVLQNSLDTKDSSGATVKHIPGSSYLVEALLGIYSGINF